MQHIHFLILSTSVFAIGFLGIFVNRKNIITILMSIELMLLSANINFIGDHIGPVGLIYWTTGFKFGPIGYTIG